MSAGIIAINAIDVVVNQAVEARRGHGQSEADVRRECIADLKVQFIEKLAVERTKALADGVASFDMALAAADLAMFLAWESEEKS